MSDTEQHTLSNIHSQIYSLERQNLKPFIQKMIVMLDNYVLPPTFDAESEYLNKLTETLIAKCRFYAEDFLRRGDFSRLVAMTYTVVTILGNESIEYIYQLLEERK